MATDNRSNRCRKCGHTYTSRYHITHCKHQTMRAWRAGHSRNAGYSRKRTAGEIFAAQSSQRFPDVIPVNTDFYRDRAAQAQEAAQ